jgi:hypothetical protein
MSRIKVRFPKDVEELSKYGLDPSVFFPPDKSYKPKKRVESLFGRAVVGQVAPGQTKETKGAGPGGVGGNSPARPEQ